MVWTNGTFPEPIPYSGPGAAKPKPVAGTSTSNIAVEEDLPF